MKKKSEILFCVIVTLLLGVLFVINNVFECNFISQKIAYIMFVTSSGYCLLMFFLKRHEVSASKRQIMKYFIISLLICIGISVTLYLFFSLTTWTRIIILLLWLIVGCFLLYIIYKKK